MPATLSIIRIGKKHMYTYTGDLNAIAEAITSCALRDEILAEAITRAAVEIDIKKQVGEQLIQMTQE